MNLRCFEPRLVDNYNFIDLIKKLPQIVILQVGFFCAFEAHKKFVGKKL